MALLEHATPGEIAHVSRLHLGKQRLANHRPHSVRANQQVAFDLRSVTEDRNGAITILHDLGHVPSGV